MTDVHAATSSAPVPASHRRDVWLGWRTLGEDSFPRTEARHLSPARMLRAAFTSRSCESPHSLHIHCLLCDLSSEAWSPGSARCRFLCVTVSIPIESQRSTSGLNDLLFVVRAVAPPPAAQFAVPNSRAAPHTYKRDTARAAHR